MRNTKRKWLRTCYITADCLLELAAIWSLDLWDSGGWFYRLCICTAFGPEEDDRPSQWPVTCVALVEGSPGASTDTNRDVGLISRILTPVRT